MAIGTPNLVITQQLVGGPKVISGTVTAESGDTTATIDLSSKLAKEIKAVVAVYITKSAALGVVLTIDYTTTATSLTVTFTNPAADATICFTVIGQ